MKLKLPFKRAEQARRAATLFNKKRELSAPLFQMSFLEYSLALNQSVSFSNAINGNTDNVGSLSHTFKVELVVSTC